MPVDGTTYLVTTKYAVEERAATAGMERLGSAAESSTRATNRLKRALIGVGAGFLGFRGVRMAKSALIDFNAEMETLQASLSTVISMQLHVPFSVAQEKASELFGTLRQMAKASPATTKDFVEMSSAIAGSVTAAGLGLKDLAEITKGGVIASQALAGGRADVIAMDIQQMLAGKVTDRDRYAKQLLGGIGMSKDGLNQIKDAEKRALVVRDALSQRSLQEGAQAFGNSFQGLTSTMKDNLQTLLGSAGEPLFEELKKEMRRWAQWLQTNKKKVDQMAASVGSALVKGFGILKDVGKFFVDNRSVLLAIAKAMLAVKAVKAIGGIAGALGAGAGHVGGVNRASKILAATYVGAKFVAAQIDLGQESKIKRSADFASVDNLRLGAARGSIGSAKVTLENLKGLGLVNNGKFAADEKFNRGNTGIFEIGKMVRGLVSFSIAKQTLHNQRTLIQFRALSDVWLKKLGPLGAKWATEMNAVTLAAVSTINPFMAFQQFALPDKKAANVNVNINKVEVPAKDPDRWIRDLTEFAAKQVRAPRQARGALGGGGL